MTSQSEPKKPANETRLRSSVRAGATTTCLVILDDNDRPIYTKCVTK